MFAPLIKNKLNSGLRDMSLSKCVSVQYFRPTFAKLAKSLKNCNEEQWESFLFTTKIGPRSERWYDKVYKNWNKVLNG